MAQLIGTAPNQVPTNGDLGSAAYLDSSAFYGTGLSASFRNRIINGDMRIDQRYAGASVTVGNGYSVDRWRGQFDSSRAAMQQSTDAPVGFNYSLSVTCTTASASGQSFIAQVIEGHNFADFQWGTSNAKPVTLSFWVKCSLPGQYTATFEDADGTRCYSAPYTINSVNTWEYKSITVPGETSGSIWNKTNGNGTQVIFDLGSASTQAGNVWGTSDAKRATGSVQFANNLNAVFKVTGVQVEKGTQATAFEYRQYGTELALCQRYYYRITGGGETYYGPGAAMTGTTQMFLVPFPVPMRADPTALETTGVGSNYRVAWASTSDAVNSAPTFGAATKNVGRVNTSTAVTITTGYSVFLYSASNTTAYLGWSAEL